MDNSEPSVGSGHEKVWYFAYGSNMKLSVMNSRGIKPLDVRVVYVPGYLLTFDVFGLPYSEPSMASIARFMNSDEASLGTERNPPPAHGVAYLLSYPDFLRVLVTEGGGVAYTEISVTGINLNKRGPESLTMTTLTAKYPRRPNVAPSLRYLTLLREGAEERGLPTNYQEYLSSLPFFVSGMTWRSRLGSSTFLWFGRRIVRVLARSVRRATDTKGRCPPWYGTLILVTYTAMWLWHDYIHAPVFGRGDGGNITFGRLQLV